MYKRRIMVIYCALMTGNYLRSATEKTAPKTQQQIANECQDFDAFVDDAFQQGLLSEPITLPKPSWGQIVLRTVLLPVALKLIACKNYLTKTCKRYLHG